MKKTDQQRSLRIAQVAPLWTSVPPSNYGGAELVVHLLTEELVRSGHDVTLFASGDSKTQAQLHAICDENLLEACTKGSAYIYECYANSNLVEAIRLADKFDVIHSHIGSPQIPLSELSKIPCLHTIHTQLTVDDLWMLRQYPNVPVAMISHSQMANIPHERRKGIATVYNACDFEQYTPSELSGTYLAFLGRMGEHKNPLGAIHIAKTLGLPILLAGKPMTQEDERYFNAKIQSLVDGVQVVYLGPLDMAQKTKFLSGASVLLFPIKWEEPFGLVIIEAMACGTPVVACSRGSVREVIEFGRTGFYADTEEELVPLIPRALSLDRKGVRQNAMHRFSHKRMAAEYLEIYRSLIG